MAAVSLRDLILTHTVEYIFCLTTLVLVPMLVKLVASTENPAFEGYLVWNFPKANTCSSMVSQGVRHSIALLLGCWTYYDFYGILSGRVVWSYWLCPLRWDLSASSWITMGSFIAGDELGWGKGVIDWQAKKLQRGWRRIAMTNTDGFPVVFLCACN